MTLDFSTSEFQMSHGRTPRGTGSWAFVAREHSRLDDYLTFTLWVNGQPYSEAKKVARAHFAGKTDTVVVLP